MKLEKKIKEDLNKKRFHIQRQEDVIVLKC